MSANPMISQGTLNRLRASVVLPDFPTLNVTPSFLHKEGVRISWGGGATTMIDAMTGRVTSPEPYLPMTTTIHLLRTQGLSGLWRKKMEEDSRLGTITIKPDSALLAPYPSENSAIEGVEPLVINGMDAGWTISLAGTYFINNNLWGGA